MESNHEGRPHGVQIDQAASNGRTEENSNLLVRQAGDDVAAEAVTEAEGERKDDIVKVGCWHTLLP